MTMSVITCDDSKNTNDIELCKEVARGFVKDVVTKATHELAQKSTNKFALERQTTLLVVPDIQYDLVGQRSPTPEEETFPWIADAYACNHTRSQDIVQRGTAKETSSAVVELSKEQEEQISVSELNEFALLYVKDVITNATVLAAKRAVARSSLVDDRTNDQGWEKVNKGVKHTSFAFHDGTDVILVDRQPESTESSQPQLGEQNNGTRPKCEMSWYMRLGGVVSRLMRSTCMCQGDNDGGNNAGKLTFV